MAYCRKCGTKLNDGANYCPNCGADNSYHSSNKGSKKKRIMFLVLLLGIVLLGAVGWYLSHTTEADQYSLEKLALVIKDADCISDFHEGLAFFNKDNKAGVVNKMGEIIVEPTYDVEPDILNSFYKDGVAIVHKNEKYGFIDKDGKEIIPCEYEEAFPFAEGMAVVKKRGKYGFVDKKGQVIVSFSYDNAYSFSGGLALVNKDGKFGYINIKGEAVIPLTFDNANSFIGELAIVEKGGCYSIINKKGDVVKVFKTGWLRDFSDGLAIYENEENDEIKYGFIDEKGSLVIPRNYYSYRGCYGDFRDGYATVFKYEEEKFGVIDKSGKTIIPFMFDFIEENSEGLFCVNKDGKRGFYDTNGNCVIPCKYDNANSFSEGLAAVQQGNLWGFVDKSGNMIIQTLFDEVNNFSDNLAIVKKDGKYGIIDKTGKSTFSSQELGLSDTQKVESEGTNEDGITAEESGDIHEYGKNSNSYQHVDVSPILTECYENIASIQSNIVVECSNFVTEGSKNLDTFGYEKLQSRFVMVVADMKKQAEKVFDNCISQLISVGASDAVENVKAEKIKFKETVSSLERQALQKVETAQYR